MFMAYLKLRYVSNVETVTASKKLCQDLEDPECFTLPQNSINGRDWLHEEEKKAEFHLLLKGWCFRIGSQHQVAKSQAVPLLYEGQGAARTPSVSRPHLCGHNL